VGVHNYEGADLVDAVALVGDLAARLPRAAWEQLFAPPVGLDRVPEALARAATGEWARVIVRPDADGRGE